MVYEHHLKLLSCEHYMMRWCCSYLIFQVRTISNSTWLGAETEIDQEKLREKLDPGLRLGDYPVLPWQSAHQRKRTGWWDNYDRRDKETPVSCN